MQISSGALPIVPFKILAGAPFTLTAAAPDASTTVGIPDQCIGLVVGVLSNSGSNYNLGVGVGDTSGGLGGSPIAGASMLASIYWYDTGVVGATRYAVAKAASLRATGSGTETPQTYNGTMATKPVTLTLTLTRSGVDTGGTYFVYGIYER